MATQQMKDYTLSPGQSIAELMLRIGAAHESLDEEIQLTFQFPSGNRCYDRVRVRKALVVLRGFMNRFGPVMEFDDEIDQDTEVVRGMQNDYLRGDMSAELQQRLMEINPDTISDWNKIKLSLLVRKRKFAKKLRDIMYVVMKKGVSKKVFKVGKNGNCIQRQKDKCDELQRHYERTGCQVLQTWAELYDEVVKGFGLGG
jgi:hypothetical protein